MYQKKNKVRHIYITDYYSAMRKEDIHGAPGWLSWLSVQLLISAQVMISQFVGSSPASGGSSLTTWSLLGIFSFSFSLPLPLSLFLSQNKQTL